MMIPQEINDRLCLLRRKVEATLQRPLGGSRGARNAVCQPKGRAGARLMFGGSLARLLLQESSMAFGQSRLGPPNQQRWNAGRYHAGMDRKGQLKNRTEKVESRQTLRR